MTKAFGSAGFSPEIAAKPFAGWAVESGKRAAFPTTQRAASVGWPVIRRCEYDG
jgi:hypothetical protein